MNITTQTTNLFEVKAIEGYVLEALLQYVPDDSNTTTPHPKTAGHDPVTWQEIVNEKYYELINSKNK